MTILQKLNQELLDNARAQKEAVEAWGDAPTEKQRGEYDELVKNYETIENSISQEKQKEEQRLATEKQRAEVDAQLEKLTREMNETNDPTFDTTAGAEAKTMSGAGGGSMRPVSYRERWTNDEDFSRVMWKHGTAALIGNKRRDAEIFFTEGSDGKADERFIQRAVSTTTQGGGVMIPHHIMNIMRRSVTPNILRRICTVVETGINNTIPMESTYVELATVAEGDAIPEKTNDIILDNTLTFSKWGAFYSITQEALDENFNLENLVMSYANNTLNNQELKSHLTSLLTQTSAGLTKTEANITFAELVSLRTIIPDEDHELGTYLLSPEFRSEIISMEDDNGRPYFPREVFISGVKELHGRPVGSSSFFPTGDNAKIALVGNFKRVVIGDPRVPIHITVDRYTKSREQKVDIIFTQRGGIKLCDANAVKAVVNPSA